MTEQLLNGSRWFHIALAVWGVVALVLWTSRPRRQSHRARTLQLLHLMYGVLITVMATGHMVAVTIAATHGLLRTTTPLWALYGIGLVYFVPGLLIAVLAARSSLDHRPTQRRLLMLDLFLTVAFIIVIESSALAVPAILNAVALRSERPNVLRSMAVATCVVYAGMLVASFLIDGP